MGHYDSCYEEDYARKKDQQYERISKMGIPMKCKHEYIELENQFGRSKAEAIFDFLEAYHNG